MTLWTAIQNFIALEATAGTLFALWIGFLAWRGPKQQARQRFQRIVRISRPIHIDNAMFFRRGHPS